MLLSMTMTNETELADRLLELAQKATPAASSFTMLYTEIFKMCHQVFWAPRREVIHRVMGR